MDRNINDIWIEEAIERYQRIDSIQDDFNRAVKEVEVSVRSPDGLVEVIVTADGSVKDVRIEGTLSGRSAAQLSRSVKAAVVSAADAAAWAKQKLHADLFGDYRPLN